MELLEKVWDYWNYDGWQIGWGFKVTILHLYITWAVKKERKTVEVRWSFGEVNMINV